jgi:hypothetical protein
MTFSTTLVVASSSVKKKLWPCWHSSPRSLLFMSITIFKKVWADNVVSWNCAPHCYPITVQWLLMQLARVCFQPITKDLFIHSVDETELQQTSIDCEQSLHHNLIQLDFLDKNFYKSGDPKVLNLALHVPCKDWNLSPDAIFIIHSNRISSTIVHVNMQNAVDCAWEWSWQLQCFLVYRHLLFHPQASFWQQNQFLQNYIPMI